MPKSVGRILGLQYIRPHHTETRMVQGCGKTTIFINIQCSETIFSLGVWGETVETLLKPPFFIRACFKTLIANGESILFLVKFVYSTMLNHSENILKPHKDRQNQMFNQPVTTKPPLYVFWFPSFT